LRARVRGCRFLLRRGWPLLRRRRLPFSRGRRAGPRPYAPLLQQLDLLPGHLLAVLVVGIRLALEVEVLRIDPLLVDDPVLLGGQVLEPVVPLCVGTPPPVPSLSFGSYGMLYSCRNRRASSPGPRGWVARHSSRSGSRFAARAARTHPVCAWRRPAGSPSGRIRLCSLNSGRRCPAVG